ncbi:dimethyl sulfoxide reductase [Trueperella bernardiae]|uniref:Anaerobic dimethyl sulfoxide reductase chain C n=1 Tax=Trueperella bernardiae TaxID=59561 RepID=A0A0W1KJ00_9ACTO|nr:DmsC/YnfH family molybdoenzyme membrane anchor subunit [Trueperella bernardiae]KTF03600.1 Anaerobic dimethyl sulfoxide reductase chain C [Trueperella bernardiae]MDK8600868.1 dimethyl sulfoxide reductase anchor subunit [Trueperella bernardiae]PKZ89237.1 dimethyl sulfoxide reductase [Trueperella bernardiae]WIM07675.1 dimethyl sulfoxide reductase anchor subunit [Trueperella bernardiae]
MNLHELPMIIFTVVAQLCVGMFLVLGAIQLWLTATTDERTTDRLTTPILYVIGPVMVFGLVASMFHMNDVTHTLNVFRHVGSSWLSREIVFGVGFAGLGFLFALLQWFRVGPAKARIALGMVTGLVGIGLVWSMSMIYSSLVTVPAWNTWVVPFQFFATTLMLGAAAVVVSLVAMTAIRQRTPATERGPVAVPSRTTTPPAWQTRLGIDRNLAEIHAPATDKEWKLTTQIVKACMALVALVAVGILISYVAHVQHLATHPEPAAAISAAAFSGAFFWMRLVLLGLGAVGVGFAAFKYASSATLEKPATLTWVVSAAFVLILAAEFMGRSLHYDSMQLIGIG